jgi:hypothetical protein
VYRCWDVEGADRAGFAQEAIGKLARAELDGHIAMQLGVARLPYFSHAAFADGIHEHWDPNETGPDRFNLLYGSLT